MPSELVLKFCLIPILYEDAQNKTLETPCQTKKLFYAASHKFGINCELRIANCELFCWHLKQFFDNPPQSIKKRIAALDVEAINYLLG
ncbi:MAG: hypothetical protein ACYTXM_41950, partial [Nostoc sp.]